MECGIIIKHVSLSKPRWIQSQCFTATWEIKEIHRKKYLITHFCAPNINTWVKRRKTKWHILYNSVAQVIFLMSIQQVQISKYIEPSINIYISQQCNRQSTSMFISCMWAITLMLLMNLTYNVWCLSFCIGWRHSIWYFLWNMYPSQCRTWNGEFNYGWDVTRFCIYKHCNMHLVHSLPWFILAQMESELRSKKLYCISYSDSLAWDLLDHEMNNHI